MGKLKTLKVEQIQKLTDEDLFELTLGRGAFEDYDYATILKAQREYCIRKGNPGGIGSRKRSNLCVDHSYYPDHFY